MYRDVTVSDCFFSGTLSGTGMTGGNTSYIHIGAFVGKSINSSIVTNNYYYGDYASTIGYEDGKVTLANLVRVYQLTGNGITATAPQGCGTTFKGVSYFKADATVTLAPQTGYAITAASYNDGSEDHEITPDNGVWSFQMQEFANGYKLVYPCFLSPQFGMSVQIGITTAYLVVRDYLPPRICYTVQHLKVIMCTPRSTV
jgi:hypothetical protein